MQTSRSHLALSLALCLLATTSACNIDPFRLGGSSSDAAVGNDANSGDDGAANLADASPPDAMLPDACIPSPESCNEMDDDCDGMIDEDFNLASDPRNCGACGTQCELPGAAGTCENSACTYDCLPDNYDLNGDLSDPSSNGCEYFCGVTNGGTEACDFADNNCDGTIDEGFNLDTDLNNCGACGRKCQILNAVEVCDMGNCTFTDCDAGYADILSGVPGCEYQCPVNPPLADEVCNGVDDDCDGVIDENVPGLGADCTDPGFESIGDTGECAFGQTSCLFGSEVCVGYVRPQPETCNDLDDDCDGTADNGFDKQNDVRYCGGCSPCQLDHTQTYTCNAGVCEVGVCAPGYVDQDGKDPDGCEYQCTPSGPEVCDGVDNDCNGVTDENLGTPPAICNKRSGSPCQNVTAECKPNCSGTTTWVCDYQAAGAETDGCFSTLVANEALCDNVDGNCDGLADESFSQKGQACDDGGIGICKGTGTSRCDPADSSKVECNIIVAGQSPGPETCNDLDDDCDTKVDEQAPGDMIGIPSGAPTFWIDTYEAARPDADGSSAGVAEHRACSRPDAVPWVNVTYLEATAACAAAGKRLCTESEWQGVCEGSGQTAYPYGNTYDAAACNGKDYDYDCSPPIDELLLPTGTPFGCPPPGSSACASEAGAIDMSGNAREWTSTQVSTSPSTRRVKGGSFNDIRQGLTCQRSFISFEESLAFPNLGFRCCSDADPSTLP